MKMEAQDRETRCKEAAAREICALAKKYPHRVRSQIRDFSLDAQVVKP